MKFLDEETECQKTKASGIELLLSEAHTSLLSEHFSKRRDKGEKHVSERALASIERDEESDLTLNREKREIPQSALLKMVLDLDQERENSRNLSRQDRAWLCHDELLMLFFACFPWFAGCLSSCRFKGPAPNIFKRQIPRDGPPFGLTARAKALSGRNPKARFWQFSFKAEETRYRCPVRGLMPDFFVPLLERRARCHRVLTQATGAVTLFVNRYGRPLLGYGLTSWLLNFTSRRGYRPVTPVACRRIFAFYWLGKYPEDYERLAAILWMKISSVVNRYPPNSKGAHLGERSYFASKGFEASRGRT